MSIVNDINRWDEGTWLGVVIVLGMLLGSAMILTRMLLPTDCASAAESQGLMTEEQVQKHYDRCVIDRERRSK